MSCKICNGYKIWFTAEENEEGLKYGQPHNKQSRDLGILVSKVLKMEKRIKELERQLEDKADKLWR